MIPPWKNIFQDRKVPRVKNLQPTTNPEIETSKDQQQYWQPEQSPKRRKEFKECLVNKEHRDSHPDGQRRRLDKPVKRVSLHLTPQDPVREIHRAHVQDRAPNRPRRRRQQRRRCGPVGVPSTLARARRPPDEVATGLTKGPGVNSPTVSQSTF